MVKEQVTEDFKNEIVQIYVTRRVRMKLNRIKIALYHKSINETIESLLDTRPHHDKKI